MELRLRLRVEAVRQRRAARPDVVVEERRDPTQHHLEERQLEAEPLARQQARILHVADLLRNATEWLVAPTANTICLPLQTVLIGWRILNFDTIVARLASVFKIAAYPHAEDSHIWKAIF